MKLKGLQSLFLSLSVLFFIACGGGGSSGGGGNGEDDKFLKILSQNTQDLASEKAYKKGDITLNFNKELNATTLSYGISLLDDTNSSMPMDCASVAKKVTCNSSSLDYNSSYTLVLDQHLKALDGSSLEQNQSFAFKSFEPGVFKLIGTNLTNQQYGAAIISQGTPIELSFSNTVDEQSIEAIFVRNGERLNKNEKDALPSDQQSAYYKIEGNKVIIGSLKRQNNTVQKLVIKKALRDSYGQSLSKTTVIKYFSNNLEDSQAVNFGVQTTNPQSGMPGISTDTNITVTFNNPVLLSSLKGNIILTTTNVTTENIKCKIIGHRGNQFASKIVDVIPLRKLKGSTPYSLTINSAKSFFGDKNMTNPYTTNFSTTSVSDDVKPTVEKVSAIKNSGFMIKFSEEVQRTFYPYHIKLFDKEDNSSVPLKHNSYYPNYKYLRFDANLSYGHSYRAEIKKIKDTQGNELVGTQKSVFYVNPQPSDIFSTFIEPNFITQSLGDFNEYVSIYSSHRLSLDTSKIKIKNADGSLLDFEAMKQKEFFLAKLKLAHPLFDNYTQFKLFIPKGSVKLQDTNISNSVDLQIPIEYASE